MSKYTEIAMRFKEQRDTHKELGDYINLCYTIKGKKFTKVELRKAFLKLINREEFDWEERAEYIEYLFVI